jgi:ornithine cyclodeaminase/alanine dehydrogenase-like protein (mu-crystallin family)
MKPVIIEKDDIVKLLEFKEIISVIEKSFIDFSSGKLIMPPPQDIVIEESRRETHIKSAYVNGSDFYCVKIASGFYDNPKLCLNSSQGMMILLDSKTGVPKCILLEDGILTDYRTAAAGAVAAKYLANANSKNVLVIGSGIQARLQIEFLLQVFEVERLFVWGRNDENVKNYCDYISKFNFLELKILPTVQDHKGVDIIVTTTPSRSPLLSSVEKGVHVNAIGADMPGKQELSSEFLAKAKIITDSTSQCEKSGELQHALKSGDIFDVYAELGEIVAKAKKGRESSDEITVFDSTGLGIQDLAIAKYVYEKHINLAE